MSSLRSPILALCAALLAGCGASAPEDRAAPVPTTDPGPVHVHGLGVNPADGALFVATHTGLFRAPPGEQTATRVGDLHQDTMGFTIVGPDRFLGSGHPDLRTRKPPYLGLIASDDAGRSWRDVSLSGRADFHVLEAAGRRVVGYGSDFESRRPLLLVSDDGGRSWQQRRPPAPLVDLALSPRSADTWVASSPDGLFVTRDAGRTWKPAGPAPGLLAWPQEGRLLRVDARGRTHVSSDRGGTWRPTGSLGGQPAALEAEGPALYAALHDGTIKVTRDDGRTWAVRSRPRASTER